MTRLPEGAETAAAIDATVRGPVLVVGSFTRGEPLDLLAGPEEHETVAAWLAESGFVRWRRCWARFDTGAVTAVRLSTTRSWSSPGDDASLLFEGSEAIPGFSHLVRPGPATLLLLAARELVAQRGRVSHDVRRQVTEALARDPGAWGLAERRGTSFGLAGAVRLLRMACRPGQPLSPSARAARFVGIWVSAGPLRAKARLVAEAVPRPRRPTVISFSGLDGSGKSTQVTRLRDTLTRLGAPAEQQWAGFKTGSSIRSALPVLDRSGTGARGAPATTPPARDPLVPSTCLRHPVGQQLWTFTVVAVNAISLWRHVLKPRRDVEVLIFDRFSPDSALKLDFHYGCNRHFDIRRQRALFVFLSPKPDVGFLVAVPGAVAHARRQEQTLDELTVMAGLYDDQETRFGLVRLDGTEPADLIARTVAEAAWSGRR